MRGRVRNVKPNAKPESIRMWINDAIRDVITVRPYWSDLLTTGIISIPDPYAVGTVTMATGSSQAIGNSTAWPVSDRVNTTLVTPVTNVGVSEIQPASMTGIAEDGILWVDGGLPTAEAVPIMRVDQAQGIFTGKFAFTHNAGATATQSSLSGLQLRLGSNFPIFTVLAVATPTSLIIDSPWGGPPQVNTSYRIIKLYVTMDVKIRKLLDAVEQKQGWPLDLVTYSLTLVNSLDPQRTDTGDPRTLFPFAPSIAGNQRWEIWPQSATARQISILYSRQWPELVDDNDLAPPFIDPTVFTDLAASTALGIKMDAKDAWYLPQDAVKYEQRAAAKLQAIMADDENRNVRDYENFRRNLYGAQHYNWAQNHAISADQWGF